MNSFDRIKSYMKHRRRVLFVSPPAMGKTSRILKAAAECEFDVLITAAGIRERVDFSGAIMPDLACGYAKELLLESMYRLVHAEKPTLWFLDDLGNAEVDVQAAIKASITKGGNVASNPNVLVFGATNRPNDKTGVRALHESLRSEFNMAFAIATPGEEEKADGAVLLGSWKEEYEGWCQWALDYEASPIIVAYHRATAGENLYKWHPHVDPSIRMADFRTWQSVIDLWKVGLNDDRSLSAAIGRADALKLLAYSELAEELPSPDSVWMDPDGAIVPDSKNAAALFLVSTTLAAAVEAKYAGQFCKYISRLPRVFTALAGRDAFRRLGSVLSGQKAWVKWLTVDGNHKMFEVD